MKERFAIYTMDLHIPISEQLSIMREVGFKQVAFTDETNENQVADWADTARLCGLLPMNWHPPFLENCDLWIEGAEHDRVEASWYQWIDIGADAGIVTEIIHPTSNPENVYVSETGADTFRRINEYAVKRGVALYLENLRTPLHNDYLFERIDSPNLTFCWDAGHEAVFTPGIDFCRRYADRLGFTHLHDNDGIRDSHTLPGNGIRDWAEVARTFREIEYNGPLALEVRPPAEARDTAEEFAAFAAETYRRLISIFGE